MDNCRRGRRKHSRRAVDDLADPGELLELGTALFLDRPLGLFHGPGQLDRTPLVAYQAYSRKVAEAQIRRLCAGLNLDSIRSGRLLELLGQAQAGGLPISQLPRRDAPGVVALEDALRATDDFVVRRTMRHSLSELLAGYDLTALAVTARAAHQWLTTSADVLLVRTAAREQAQAGCSFLAAMDGNLRVRIELALPCPGRPEYFERTGSERLRNGLRVTRTTAWLATCRCRRVGNCRRRA